MSADELKYFDIIERYVDGEMSETERLDFEQNLSTDELLKKEYDSYVHIVKGIGDHFIAKHKNQLRAMI